MAGAAEPISTNIADASAAAAQEVVKTPSGPLEWSQAIGHGLHENWAWLVNKISAVILKIFPMTKASGAPFVPHEIGFMVVSVMIVMGLGAFFMYATRKLDLYPRRRIQSFVELLYESLYNFVVGIIGPDGKKYVPLVGTVFLYILFMNWIGLVPGFVAPTSNLNVTFTMGITVVLLVQIIAVYETGLKAYLLHLCGEPLWLAPLMFPIHVVGELAKPISLAFRLFGNVFGEDQVVINFTALGIGMWMSYYLPLPFQLPMLCLGTFTCFVQAMVFAMLTAIYIVLFIGDHHGHDDHGDHAHDSHHAEGKAAHH